AAAEAVEVDRDGDGLRARPIELVVLLVGPALLAVGAGVGLGRGIFRRFLRGRGKAGVDGGEVGRRAVELGIGGVAGPGQLAVLAIVDQRLLADEGIAALGIGPQVGGARLVASLEADIDAVGVHRAGAVALGDPARLVLHGVVLGRAAELGDQRGV